MSGPRPLLIALLGAACLAGSGCARLAEAMFAPQTAATETATAVVDRTNAAATANSFGQSVDNLLAGNPANSDELSLLRLEIQRRMMAGLGRAGSAQEDPVRRVPWHPRTPQVWPGADNLVLVLRQPDERGTYVHFTPLPDGIPAGDPPIGLDLSPIRVYGGQRPPLLPVREMP